MDFPKGARVRKKSEYLNFFNSSEVKRLGTCIVFRVSNEKKGARVGMTIKARTSSVFRNKIKRQIREEFRLSRARLKSFDYNIVVPGQVRVSYRTSKEVRKNLQALWNHANPF